MIPFLLLAVLAACSRPPQAEVYTLNSGEIRMRVTNYGGRVLSLCTRDREGQWENIVVGHPDVQAYIHPAGERFLGASVGPVANRIGGASFRIGGQVYETPRNDNGQNTLHGGFTGIDHLFWKVEAVTDSSITFSFVHPDGFEGFPGNLSVTAVYTLSGADFRVEFLAETDQPTPVNLTHHPFFCLRGQGVDTVEPYELQIRASHYLPIDALSIPTGEIAPVEGTPFDFREAHRIGERIGEENEQLAFAHGYDHNWCLDKAAEGVESVCTLYDPQTGRCIEVLTDQPGLQVYSGNFFDGSEKGSNGKELGFRSSIALEAQGWPDAVSNPQFPSCLLQPGEVYTHTTVYRFSAR